MVCCVLFDLDDTLFDHAHCARTALAAVRSSHECFGTIEPLALERSHSSILEELHHDVAVGRLALDVARTERFRRLFRSAGFEPDDHVAAATAAAYRQAYIDSRRAVEGAAGLLEAVHRRARIGIVSNNLLAEQREKLRHCGLDRFVDVLTVSEEAGVSKPDPKIFNLALERLGCRPANAVMVGDSWAADIVGAQAAGIRAIWLATGHTGATEETQKKHRPDVAVLRALTPVDDVVRVIFGEAPPNASVAVDRSG